MPPTRALWLFRTPLAQEREGERERERVVQVCYEGRTMGEVAYVFDVSVSIVRHGRRFVKQDYVRALVRTVYLFGG